MKRKILLASLLLAVVTLLTQLFVLNDYLPSDWPSNKYFESLKIQYGKQKRSLFNFTFRTHGQHRSAKRKQYAKGAAKSMTSSVKTSTRPKTSSNHEIHEKMLQLSSLLNDEVKALKSRKVLKKARVKMVGEGNGITALVNSSSRGQMGLKYLRNDVKSRYLHLEGSKIVLIYTPLFGESPWKGLRNTFQFTHFRNKPCAVTNCSLTYRRSLFSRSDVVVFHGQDMPPVFELEELNNRRPKRQIWVYLVLENPANARDTHFLEDMFNWTVTYERNSDIYLPYGSYTALKPGEKPLYGEIKSRQKDRLAVWTVSNCGGLRDRFVQELGNYIRVDIFGSCADLIYQPHLEEDECMKHTPECDNLLKRYKFQLAFENGNCVDYVTEKYWGAPLELGNVPVVLGGANYAQIAIPGSFINALDFDSVKALAEYLLYLDKNDTAYMEYFAWRKKFKVYGSLKPEGFNTHHPWTCELCTKAQKSENKTYRSLSDFRNPAKLCGLHEDKLYQMVRTPDGTQGNDYYGTDLTEPDDDEDGDEWGDGEEEEEEEDVREGESVTLK